MSSVASSASTHSRLGCSAAETSVQEDARAHGAHGGAPKASSKPTYVKGRYNVVLICILLFCVVIAAGVAIAFACRSEENRTDRGETADVKTPDSKTLEDNCHKRLSRC
jgi:hypothetical protein